MKIDLTGRIALVTGATGELGRVITRTLAGCGARVAIHYHQAADRAATLQQELPGCRAFQAASSGILGALKPFATFSFNVTVLLAS